MTPNPIPEGEERAERLRRAGWTPRTRLLVWACCKRGDHVAHEYRGLPPGGVKEGPMWCPGRCHA